MFSLQPLYTADQVRSIDARAIARLQDEGFGLMQRAAAFSLKTLQSCWPQARSLSVLAGPGNNGGDALVLAALARRQGYRVRLHLLGALPGALQGAAAQAWALAESAGLRLATDPPQPACVQVDGLFGTGLARPLRGEAALWVEALQGYRAQGQGVLALDIPSGWHADSGQALGPAVVADHCCSFVARKLGLDLGGLMDAAGQVHFDDLGVRAEDATGLEAPAHRVLSVHWPARRRGQHKGDCGHVLCVGGAPEYAGALVLAGEGALRAGAGKVSLLSSQASQHPARSPEMMCKGIEGKNSLVAAASEASALCVGPGLGREDAVLGWLEVLRRAPRVQVWDADALFFLTERPELRPAQLILTPHPAEAARLLGRTTASVQADRLGALDALVRDWNCPIILKGARTLVGAPGERPRVIPGGHPGMAVGGMGDALAGMVAGLAAQGLPPFAAATAGAWLLAAAADSLRHSHGAGLLPSDVLQACAHLHPC